MLNGDNKTTVLLAKLPFPKPTLQTKLDLLTLGGCLEGKLNEE